MKKDSVVYGLNLSSAELVALGLTVANVSDAAIHLQLWLLEEIGYSWSRVRLEEARSVLTALLESVDRKIDSIEKDL